MDVRLKRFPLAILPTPLVPARTLPMLIKRDDLCGFAAAGHKARQLEFLLGDALAQGCDVIVTGGGPKSNWVPAAATAAAVARLDCELVDGPREELDDAILERAAQLEADGRRPYAIPRGGATAVGAAGLVLAAAELDDVEPGTVVVATGSGGACAGLAVGLADRGWRVIGASVSRPLDEATAQVNRLAAECAALLDRPPPAPVELVDMRGLGFGLSSLEGDEAAWYALEREGLRLDATYTAKAFALAMRLPRDRGPLVFWHTFGGAPTWPERSVVKP